MPACVQLQACIEKQKVVLTYDKVQYYQKPMFISKLNKTALFLTRTHMRTHVFQHMLFVAMQSLQTQPRNV